MDTERIFFYKDRADQFRAEQNKYAKHVSFTSMLRLALFLVFAWFIYAAFEVRFAGYDLVYALIAIVALLVVVFWADTNN
jgi:FtsH-binding integral membrane protein